MQSRGLWEKTGIIICGIGTTAYIIGMLGTGALLYRENSQEDRRLHFSRIEKGASSQEIRSFYKEERSINTANSVAELLTDAGAVAMAAGFSIGLLGYFGRREEEHEEHEDYENFQLPANEENRTPSKRR